MSRTVDIVGLRTKSAEAVKDAMSRYDKAAAGSLDYDLVRWIAQMTAVDIHAHWERYVENRLVAALNHNAAHFLTENGIKSVTRVSSGLAFYVIRSGGKYFDFRSMSELLDKGDRWLGKTNNPFRTVSSIDRSYIDTLAAVRNCVVHRSDAAIAAYKRSIRDVYSIVAAPEPDEFLNAKDSRSSSPARYKCRLHGLAAIVRKVIQNT